MAEEVEISPEEAEPWYERFTEAEELAELLEESGVEPSIGDLDPVSVVQSQGTFLVRLNNTDGEYRISVMGTYDLQFDDSPALSSASLSKSKGTRLAARGVRWKHDGETIERNVWIS